MRMPSPGSAKRLAALAKQHQTNAMAKIHVARVGTPSHKIAAHNPDLYQAAKQMAQGEPGHYPDHATYNDALSSAHKAMRNATAFHKASKGLAPRGKSSTANGLSQSFRRTSGSGSVSQRTPLRGTPRMGVTK
jgi:hypothetical protein